MRILISNDDGARAPGIVALKDALAPLGETWTVAPATEQSAQSHSLTLHKPLHTRELGPRWFSVSGTPADSVYMGLYHLMDGAPDVVISGINRGSNLGNDVYYSGTVAAAREGRLAGFPSIAISLHPLVNGGAAPTQWHWDTAAQVAVRILPAVIERGIPDDCFLNVNVPNVPLSELKGIHASAMGRRRYETRVEHRVDPRGRPYFWLGGDHVEFDDNPMSDGTLTEQGWATVTPLHSDLTDREFLEDLRGWFDG